MSDEDNDRITEMLQILHQMSELAERYVRLGFEKHPILFRNATGDWMTYRFLEDSGWSSWSTNRTMRVMIDTNWSAFAWSNSVEREQQIQEWLSKQGILNDTCAMCEDPINPINPNNPACDIHPDAHIACCDCDNPEDG